MPGHHVTAVETAPWRCLVPRLAPGECQLWVGGVANDDRLAGLLDDTETRRWLAFRAERARRLFLTAHAAARIVLAGHCGLPPEALRFDRTCFRCRQPHGKPRLLGADRPLEFSLSHTVGCIAVAVSVGLAVGVDVEHLPRVANYSLLTARALGPCERQGLAALPPEAQPAGFLAYWTRKEALLKATGHGLTVPLPALQVSGPGEAPVVLSTPPGLPLDAARLDVVDFDPGPGYAGCLAVLGRPGRITLHRSAPLLEVFGGSG